ncbi:MAG TPA: methyltransferase domain-containing protein [Solirubrobacteraceae bacterium]|nr:methyltransferase domain-containing protein [Solirubrobacteraceae bacterium]
MTREPSIWGVAEAYERYIGRWSEPVGAAFLDWLALPAGLRWLDVGCGTGALSRGIARAASPALVHGIDSSAAFVGLAAASTGEAERTRFTTGDALDLPVGDGAFDVAVSGLVLNFLGDHGRAVAELRRSVRPGGTVAVYVWDYADGMQLIRRFWDAAVALDPAAAALDEGRRFPICAPDALAALFAGGGLAQVETRPIVTPTVFSDLDDLWEPFLGAQGPAPAYVAGLAEPDRARLRERLRSSLPVAADGSIALSARAFAVRGVRPES